MCRAKATQPGAPEFIAVIAENRSNSGDIGYMILVMEAGNGYAGGGF